MSTETMSRAVSSIIDVLEKLLARRRWVLQELRRFEERYGMSSEEFVKAWRDGRIPEPEDPDLLADFLTWEGLYEELRRLEKQILERLGRRV